MSGKAESALRSKIKRALERRNAKVYVLHGSAYQQGLPDLLVFWPWDGGATVLLEVKHPPGTRDPISGRLLVSEPTALQERTILDINARHGHAHIVRSVEEALTVMKESTTMQTNEGPRRATEALVTPKGQR